MTRVLLRAVGVVSASLKLSKPAIFSKHCFRNVSTNLPSLCTPNTGFSLRSFSQTQKTPEMNVEFDYVKRATNDSNVLIVDVREPDEIKEHGKIPNSVNIPLGSIEVALQMPNTKFEKSYQRKKPSANSEIIFYCMIGKRSAKAQESAQKFGFKNAKNYLGSFIDWAAKTSDKV